MYLSTEKRRYRVEICAAVNICTSTNNIPQRDDGTLRRLPCVTPNAYMDKGL